MVVLDVGFEMFGQAGDPFGKDRDLYLRRTCIAGLRSYDLITSALRLVASDIVTTFSSASAALQPGQVEHALGDDLATVHFGKGHKLARYRDVDYAVEDGCVPSTQ
jgi:hypothetical protein